MDELRMFDITPEKEASKLQFFRRQLGSGPPPVTRREVDLTGKTAIITGANGDIGLQCSRQLLELGLSKLILAARDEAKGEAARKSLSDVVKSGVTVEVWKLDYASYESIVAFAQRAEGLSRLDILVLNAGVSRASFALNPKTGHEEDIQTNYLSTVLLMLLVLGILKKNRAAAKLAKDFSPGRIVLVSSDTAAWATFPEKTKNPLLPAFDDKNVKFDVNDRYATSKLLGQLFISELAKRVPTTLAIVNCANPGLCYSGLQRELGSAAAVMVRVIGRSPSVGARTFVHAAAKLDESSHGHYVEDGKLRPMAPIVYTKEGKEVAQRLWNETMQELSFAGVQEIIEGLN